MNYSRLPTFVPDYRHVLWRERYYNRVGLFCFLFPGYPSDDYPFGRRACDEALDPEPELVTILDPRLRTAILPVYRIGFAAALGKPFSAHLEQAGPRYGWPVVTRAGNGLFLRTDPPNLPGLARLGPLASAPATFQLGVTPDGPEPTSSSSVGGSWPRAPLASSWTAARSRTAAGHRTGPSSRRTSRRELTCWSCRRTRAAPTPRPTTCTSPRSCGGTWRSVTWGLSPPPSYFSPPLRRSSASEKTRR